MATTFIQRSTGQAVAFVEHSPSIDNGMDWWLTDLQGRRIGDVYPYAAGPKMEAVRRFGYVFSDVSQSARECVAYGPAYEA